MCGALRLLSYVCDIFTYIVINKRQQFALFYSSSYIIITISQRRLYALFVLMLYNDLSLCSYIESIPFEYHKDLNSRPPLSHVLNI